MGEALTACEDCGAGSDGDRFCESCEDNYVTCAICGWVPDDSLCRHVYDTDEAYLGCGRLDAMRAEGYLEDTRVSFEVMLDHIGRHAAWILLQGHQQRSRWAP